VADPPDPLIVGLGNRLRADDGAGLAAAEIITARRPELRVVSYEGEPLGLVELWEGVDSAIVIDAVAGDRPGRIWWLSEPERLLGHLPGAGSTHLLGLAETIELARALGRAPRELTVIGIEAERFDLGEGLSPPIRRAAERVAAAILLSTAVARAGDGGGERAMT
jgi:hydrogenase maturation protease